MKYFEEVSLPAFDIKSFYQELVKLRPVMGDRYQHAKGWVSIDLVVNSTPQLVLTLCPTVRDWLKTQNFKKVYAAVLDSRGHIDWHRDQTHEKMSDAINLYIQTNKFSVIQFEDGTNWKPETGKAYRFRADIKHRVINASKQARVVLNLW